MVIDMLTFEIIKDSEFDECSDLFAESFLDYDYFAMYVRDKDTRRIFLKRMILMEMNTNRDIEYFLGAKENGKIVAFTAMCPPEYKEPSYFQYMKHGLLKCVLTGGIKDSLSWAKMEAKAKAPCMSLENTWYINSITVDKNLIGQGIGTDFMSYGIIPFIKEKGGNAMCLFTNSEINRKFYIKNSFEEFDSTTFSYKGTTIGSWSYKRDI